MAKKYKVMQFIHGLSMGGAEALVKDYTAMLDKEIESVIVTIEEQCGYANEKQVKENGVRIISLRERMNLLGYHHPIKRTWYHFDKRAWKRAYVEELRKVIMEEKPDCIHVHLFLLTYLVTIADVLKGIRLFYTCHNLPSVMFPKNNVEEIEAAKKLIKDSGLRLIALHGEMKKELDHMFGVTNTLVVRNGIDLKRFQVNSTTKAEMRKNLGIEENAFVVGHVGRFASMKNHTFLIDVFAEVEKQRKDAFMLLVGSGDEKEAAMSKLDHLGLRSRCLCLENRGDIPDIMRAMDVFVFPSTFEGLGIVVVEAQASALRCVISDRVPKDVLLSDKICSLPLEVGADEWAKVVLDNNMKPSEKTGCLTDYDMMEEVKYLARIYKGEV